MPPTLTLPPNPPAAGKAAGNLHGPPKHHLPPPATLDASPVPIVDLLDAIWHRVMEMRFACYDEAHGIIEVCRIFFSLSKKCCGISSWIGVSGGGLEAASYDIYYLSTSASKPSAGTQTMKVPQSAQSALTCVC
jgi:hypothetical protein